MKTRRNVRVIVLRDQEHLGEVGDVIHVRPGYARNYLLPRRLACLESADALRRIEREKARAADLRRKRADEIAAIAKSLQGVNITLEQRASEEGHLYGSVDRDEIAKALQGRGIGVEPRHVELESAIKELGIFTVKVRLDAETSADVRLWVVDTSSS